MSNHVKDPVADPMPIPPSVVLAAAGVAHLIITTGAVLAINASNARKEADAREGS